MVILAIPELGKGLEVDGKSSWSFVASLVNVAGGVVEHSQHRHQAIAVAVGASNVRSTCPDVVDVEPDASRGLGDESALLECVVDPFNAVAGHGEQEARGELGPGGGGVEEGW